jgi:hypothetical protein
MKRKSISISLLSLLIFSLLLSSYTQGLVAPDQLELTVGSYVKGKMLFSNTTHSDHHTANVEISVDNIFNATDIARNIVAILTEIEILDSEAFDMGPFNTFSYTSLLYEFNRSTFIGVAQLLLANSTYSAEMSLLHKTNFIELINRNNSIITIGSYSIEYGDLDIADPKYDEVTGLMAMSYILNYGLIMEFPYTILAISPQANTGDTINFELTDGTVIGKPTINTPDATSYDTIHVEYSNTFVVGFDDVGEVDVFYDAKTGFILRSIEKDTASNSQFEFSPQEINIVKSGLLPFPFLEVLVAIAAFSIILIVYKRRK